MKAGDYIVEYSKVFINLSSLVLGLSITFVQYIIGGKTAGVPLLAFAWVLWVVSILFGAFAIRRIAGTVDDDDNGDDSPTPIGETIYSGFIKLLLSGQLATFVLGFLIVMWIAATGTAATG